ncbi:hypothetical protein PGAG_00232 [Phaeocystis globosa virus 12T]|uniref:Uncharacterized protein n=1 Tax=Phaeocystis globosa virus PgV-16T TaxID=3071227 RepID=A0AC59EXC0_9VIRU|nr:hypothetical protein PGCG_00272 [Phaeocystis globosa virus]AET73121.1 hypothetical protein PGAG_00232 [Phaeocystis globosa virus 12T]AET73944.1 hypothetical protein PGBG_00236 [Phaeocystis globosa virus 14T]AGM15583.1 hypothetical protein PGCG_00272 [Phaeocystis globosa virus PgV-16T]UYE94313.1 hypothetical protein PGV14T_00272 [Phaeocystis globosa virus]
MVRTLKRIPRKNRRPKATKTKRPKAGGTKRRLRGGGVNDFLERDITGADVKDGLKSMRDFFTTEPKKPTVLEKVTQPVVAVKRLVAPGAATGGSRRRRIRNKTKKH